jgi:hypothetical protein
VVAAAAAATAAGEVIEAVGTKSPTPCPTFPIVPSARHFLVHSKRGS